MRLQTDLEFKQNQILKLNDEFNVDMFHTRLRGGKAFAAEQKIREFKKLLLIGKSLEKQQGKRLKPNDLIKKVTQHMNETLLKKLHNIGMRQFQQSMNLRLEQLKREV